MVRQFSVHTRGQGLYEITPQVQSSIDDLERWIARLVPEGDPFYTHEAEGPDDMPAHIRAALTNTSLSIPIVAGRLALGACQGVYLWEHRRVGSERELVLHIGA
jgi:secondary thiamine-phosphate synthase enzyme